MNIKTVEETYHWKPEDGDYQTKIFFGYRKSGFLELLNRCGLHNICKSLLLILLKYFQIHLYFSTALPLFRHINYFHDPITTPKKSLLKL
jgi:hypothetical protein